MTGIPMTSRNVAWDGIFAGLMNGMYDAVASGVSVTEERKATMDFSTPILLVTQSILSMSAKPTRRPSKTWRASASACRSVRPAISRWRHGPIWRSKSRRMTKYRLPSRI